MVLLNLPPVRSIVRWPSGNANRRWRRTIA
jgi:hypothetical protein